MWANTWHLWKLTAAFAGTPHAFLRPVDVFSTLRKAKQHCAGPPPACEGNMQNCCVCHAKFALYQTNGSALGMVLENRGVLWVPFSQVIALNTKLIT